MGWASGSSIADSVWDAIKKYIPKDKKLEVAKDIVEIFENQDCDTMHETQLWDIVKKKCPKCKGEGCIESDDLADCDKCNGEGEISK